MHQIWKISKIRHICSGQCDATNYGKFINYLVENWGTKFFSQISPSEKKSPNDDKKSPVKTPIVPNSDQNGDPCPICAVEIKAILQVKTFCC